MFDDPPEDFTEDYRKGSPCRVYAKGALLGDSSYKGELYEVTPDLWNYSERETFFSPISMNYYEMIIEECKKEGISVVAVIPPKTDEASLAAARWDAMRDYFDSKEIRYLNYNTYEQYKRMNLSLSEDYYNKSHLNRYGAVKFTGLLTEDLSQMFELENHRGDEYYKSEWEDALEQFHANYSID